MALGSRNSSSPQTPPSRARPDCLTPPKNDPAPRDLPFISTMPDFSATLLGLMGLSSGTYVGFKMPARGQ